MDSNKTPAPTPEARLHFLDYWRIIRLRKTIILLVFLLILLTTVVVTFLLPPEYAGVAAIRVERDRTDVDSFMSQQSAYGTVDPYFIETEFRVIRSQLILDKVIERLNLNTVWGRRYSGQTFLTPQTREILLAYLGLTTVRNTSVIEIRFRSGDTNEAARVANEVADVYKDWRVEERNRQITAGVEALTKQYEEQMAKVHVAESNLYYLRGILEINDLDPSSIMPSSTLSAETLRRLEGQRVEAEQIYAMIKAYVDQLTHKDKEQLRNILSATTENFVNTSTLREELSALAAAENRLVAMRAELGPENSEFKKLAAQVADLTIKVDAAVDGILISLATKLSAAKAGLDTITAQVEGSKKSDQERATKGQPYYNAKAKLAELKQLADAIQLRANGTEIEKHLPRSTVVIIADRADPATLKPVKPKKTLNITLGVIFGLVVGVGLAFFIEYLDTSVKTIDDVERALQSPVLGVIPQNVGYLINEGAESPHAEAYRVLRTNLLFSRKDETLNTLAIVSAGAGEGKSTTIFNLATTFAQNGQRVIIVDSDLRRPSLHKILRVSNAIGLTNYLLKQNTLEEVIQTSPIPTLDFMASGKLPSSSMGILSSSAMKDLIRELKARYDFVFFDSPPIMGVSDASILASEVDMTIQVIQYRRYPQPMNIRAKQLIEKVGGNLMGIVLNNINMAQDESYYYYSGYYHEYYSKNNEDEAAETAAAGKKA
ncbi:MAG: Tyrosine-protein kinase YwqD [Verrucomicrobiota bacterium]|jgi:capsular exopolysaccharide synthesis family protein